MIRYAVRLYFRFNLNLPDVKELLAQRGIGERQRCQGWRINNRAENSHQPIRRPEKKFIKFKSQGSPHRFLATRAEIYSF